MNYLQYFISFFFVFDVSSSLLCHWCSHKNSKEAARLQIHDKVQSTPDWCEERKVCEGNWCVQSLVGGNVSFGCVDQTALQYIWEAEQILSHCTASFDPDGISHATCWCRSHDFCNSTNSSTISFFLLAVPLILLFYLN
ncbi:hypothetical protein M3Y97_00675900 [Aphelenchoides bicaudatus]|nr:hypothetical protein M3Y97_00675900 [Aphelenchoides bicaudatus]